MVTKTEASEFVKRSFSTPVLDVRSPAEFQNGHIPGAINFPLFSDHERAEIGTLYKQVGKDAAINRGLELVEPKLKEMYAEGLALTKANRLLVHCWRGGKRSESVAWLLSLSGVDVGLLNGGYKNFRRWVLEQFDKTYSLIIVGGRTGSGKTEVLHALATAGEQVLDLEKMADHKGSAFGRLGATREVTQAQFENDMAFSLAQMDAAKVIWVEDESRGIGKLVIPEKFWKQMRACRVFYIDLDRKEQLNVLVRTYGSFPKEEIIACIQKVSEKLGGLKTREIIELVEEEDITAVASALLDYYDKTYHYGLSKRDPSTILKFEVDHFDPRVIADELIIASRNKNFAG